MNAAAGQSVAGVPGGAPDALASRLSALRAARRDPGWAATVLALAREVTLAEAGAVLARSADGSWAALAPETEDAPPEAWCALAEAALGGRGLALAPAGEGRWRFAVSLGPADPPGPAPRRAALLLEVTAPTAREAALTRERVAFLGAVAEAGALEAVAQAQAPAALATAAGDAVLRAADLPEALHRAAAVLAGALPGAERVTIVLHPGTRAARLGLSDQRMVETAAPLARALAALAEEAVGRDAPHLVAAGAAASPAERGFAAAFGAGRALLTVPARAAAPLAIVVAFSPGVEPAPEAGERLAPAARLLSGVLAGPAPGRVQRRRRGLAVLLGAAAVVGLLAVLPRPAEVAAPVVLQPERARSVTAPFDGILDTSAAQPGDAVRAGETPLARLVTREVELELAAARARAANDRREAAMARAAAEPAREQLALLAARRAEAQVALLENRLALADIRAPVDGTLVAGDLRRSLGQPVQRGQVLFEIALPGPLRAEVLVLDEHIQGVAPGQRVRLAPAAEPGRVRTATVQRARPMAEVVAGRNVFRVVAEFEPGEAEGLRPGMEGWARIETGRTSWLAFLLRDPLRWIRRQLWI